MLLKEINNIENLLNSFIKHGKIKPNKLIKLGKFQEMCIMEQRMILADSLISLENQRDVFSTLKNIRETTGIMKHKLLIAHSVGENPTTVEMCLQIMPTMKEILNTYDVLKGKFSIDGMKKMKLLSFDLLRLTRRMGFARDYEKELKENKMSENQKITFIENFKDNLKVIHNEYENTD